MVIGKRVRAPGKALRCECCEKPLGMRDAGNGDTRRIAQNGVFELERDIGNVSPGQRHLRHRECRTACAARVRTAQFDDRIDRCQSRGRLAQRSGGEQPRIAKCAFTVDDCDLDVAIERVMLQAIVGDNDVDIRRIGEQCASGGGPIGANPYGHACFGEDQRLVTRVARSVCCDDATNVIGTTTVTATDDARMKAALPQRGDERCNERRFAGATDGDVADDDDGDGKARTLQQPAPVTDAPQRSDASKEPGKRKQRR